MTEKLVPNRKIIFLFSNQTYVVGTQKNCLDETVLVSTHNICWKLWVKKYWQFYAENVCSSKPVDENGSTNGIS